MYVISSEENIQRVLLRRTFDRRSIMSACLTFDIRWTIYIQKLILTTKSYVDDVRTSKMTNVRYQQICWDVSD